MYTYNELHMAVLDADLLTVRVCTVTGKRCVVSGRAGALPGRAHTVGGGSALLPAHLRPGVRRCALTTPTPRRSPTEDTQ